MYLRHSAEQNIHAKRIKNTTSDFFQSNPFCSQSTEESS